MRPGQQSYREPSRSSTWPAKWLVILKADEHLDGKTVTWTATDGLDAMEETKEGMKEALRNSHGASSLSIRPSKASQSPLYARIYA